MRQIFIAVIASGFMLASCTTAENKSTSSGTSEKTEKNLSNARAVAKAFGTGNAASIDSVVADNFIDHTDRGDKMGRDSLKAMITWMKDHGKDMKMETLREVGDDEYVFQWMRYTGVSDGAMGPAGPYDMKVVEVSKHKDGKIVEHWAYMDMAEMMKMMPPPPAAGIEPAMGVTPPAGKMDTTKKP